MAPDTTSRPGCPTTQGRRALPGLLWAVLLLALVPLVPGCAAPPRAPLEGVCTSVQDGDSIEVRLHGRTERIRLEGIDAPEHGRPYSSRARRHLTSLVLHRNVTIQPRDVDRYGRTVARVRVDGLDTSEEMVRAGLAWHYVRYSDDPTLARLQREARAARRGLWADDSPLAPWKDREETRQRGDRARHPAAEPNVRPGPTPPSASDLPFHGNRRSHVFHAPTCRHYRCKNCTKPFPTRRAALAAGFRPCGMCRP